MNERKKENSRNVQRVRDTCLLIELKKCAIFMWFWCLKKIERCTYELDVIHDIEFFFILTLPYMYACIYEIGGNRDDGVLYACKLPVLQNCAIMK